jgi:hypothetical protein
MPISVKITNSFSASCLTHRIAVINNKLSKLFTEAFAVYCKIYTKNINLLFQETQNIFDINASGKSLVANELKRVRELFQLFFTQII